MILTIIIAFTSLMGLVVLHELGHFLLARKFGVKVEEFGIGFPPRIIARKIGETVYSLNLLPLGAFVKLYGEEKRAGDQQSFSNKAIWKRALIIAGGVISFWAVTAVILAVLGATWGIPAAVDDEADQKLNNPRVQITAIAPSSPAETAGLKIGDVIMNFQKVSDVQNFTEQHRGEKTTFVIQRGKETFGVKITPRMAPPEGQGALGIGLSRVAMIKYSWYAAPLEGILLTGRITGDIFLGFGHIIANLVKGQGVPAGFQVAGPVGIFDQLKNSLGLGLNYFLYFLAVISIYLAIFNILPIPAVDGGRMIFLFIEAVRKKPVSEAVEKGIIAISFFALIALMIFVTFKDIVRIF